VPLQEFLGHAYSNGKSRSFLDLGYCFGMYSSARVEEVGSSLENCYRLILWNRSSISLHGRFWRPIKKRASVHLSENFSS
jgi:hypothetical protein